MMLADHAQVADGKLFISGGGWSTCGPGPTPCSVAVIFHVPWQETGEKVSFALRLIDEDGRGVMQPGAQDGLPVQVNGHFEARRQELGVGKGQLYYLILYPRDRTSEHPLNSELDDYANWFEGVKLKYDIPGKGLIQGP